MNMIDRKVIAATRNIIKGANICAFTTIGLDGFPRMRYMGAFVARERWRFELACQADSHKIAEIFQNEKAQLSFWSKGFRQVAALWGKARLVQSVSERKQVYLKTAPLEIFPEFGPSFGVIRFEADRLEYLNLNIRNSPFIVDLKVAKGS